MEQLLYFITRSRQQPAVEDDVSRGIDGWCWQKKQEDPPLRKSPQNPEEAATPSRPSSPAILPRATPSSKTVHPSEIPSYCPIPAHNLCAVRFSFFLFVCVRFSNVCRPHLCCVLNSQTQL